MQHEITLKKKSGEYADLYNEGGDIYICSDIFSFFNLLRRGGKYKLKVSTEPIKGGKVFYFNFASYGIDAEDREDSVEWGTEASCVWRCLYSNFESDILPIIKKKAKNKSKRIVALYITFEYIGE